ncbi:MAG: hypothetical protein OEZ48_07290 [Candidatus Bathyarchaeota archaeon]|nr:hypothetical protein [Candidatus Bathyarchaeota archaeon]MDH5687650.1 hypothetical protein [Candidatus Bathyarchaeota archaeon]
MSSIETVQQSIEELIEKFEGDPNFFTSEMDFHCYLYHLLVSKENLQRNFISKDEKNTGLVHAEYPSVLGFHVDLVVFEPKTIANYKLKEQRVMCQIEIKVWRSIARFNVENERQLRGRLGEDKQAHKFIIYLYLAKKPEYWQEFLADLRKLKGENEKIFLESTTAQALVTKIEPGISW